MVDCRPNIADPRLSVPERSKAWSGDESTIPDSTLSVYSDDRDTEFDVTSSLPTVRSLSPASNFLEDYVSSPENTLKYENTNGHSFEQGKDASLDSCFQKQDVWSFSYRFNPEMESCFTNSKPMPPIPDASSPDLCTFLPINPMPGQASVARTASPGMNKMLLSLLDHPVERQCSPVASTLYKNTATHCNPSWLGQYTLDECVEFTQWMNDFFKFRRVATRISDLARDLGDGITLLDLVQVLVGTPPPQVHVKPALDVQKHDNIHVCLQFLARNGVPVHGIPAEDIVKGNLKVVLALCHCLRRHFGSASGPVLLVKSPCSGHQQNVTIGSYEPVTSRDYCDLSSGYRSDSVALNRGDAAILNWVGGVVGREVADFRDLQTGTVLCLLLNKIVQGAIPDVVIKYGLPSEKISLSLQVSRKDFGILSSLSTDDILKGRSVRKLSNYLRSLQQEFVRRLAHKEHRNLAGVERQSDLSVKDKSRNVPAKPGVIANKPQISRARERLGQLNQELKLLKMAISDQSDIVQSFNQGYGLGRDEPDSIGQSHYFSDLSFGPQTSEAKKAADSTYTRPTSSNTRIENENGKSKSLSSSYTCFENEIGKSRSPSSYTSFTNLKSQFYLNSTHPPLHLRQSTPRLAMDTVRQGFSPPITRQATSVPTNSDRLTYSPSTNRTSAKLDFTPERRVSTDREVLKSLNALKRAAKHSPREGELSNCTSPLMEPSFENRDSSVATSTSYDAWNPRRQSDETSPQVMNRSAHAMTALVRLSSKKANALS